MNLIFKKKTIKRSGDEIDNHQFKSVEDIILTLTTLSGFKRYSDAIRLFERFENEIKGSEYEIDSLIAILKICQKKFDTPRMIRFAKRLKVLDPNHPWVVELIKYYPI